MLVLRDVRVRYADRAEAAVDGISLAADRGECVAIVGPSGGGKTTLLRTINATVPLTGGSIAVGGVDVGSLDRAALRRLRARVAMIAQQHDLIENLPVAANVMAGALGRWSLWHALRFLILPSTADLDEARAALDAVGMPEKLCARTAELSGGQQQRVAIARALVQHPEVMLADEPVASLDPALGAAILALLCDLARERGLVLLCSLHQPDLALRFFDRVVGVERGRVRFDRSARSSVASDLAFVRGSAS